MQSGFLPIRELHGLPTQTYGVMPKASAVVIQNRTGVFIDGAYLEYLLNKQFNQAPIDFERFVRAITPRNTELLRAYYYHSLPYVDDSVEEKIWNLYEGRKRFFHALNMKSGITVRQGKVTRRYDQNGEPYYEQKLVDILLVLDLTNFSIKHLIDHAVIVSGDSNFVPAVALAQAEGVKVTVWHSPTEAQSNGLLVICDECYPIEQQLLDFCAPGEREPPARDEPTPAVAEPLAAESRSNGTRPPIPSSSPRAERNGNGRPPQRMERPARASGWEDDANQPRGADHEQASWGG